jgi:hypothetical protein
VGPLPDGLITERIYITAHESFTALPSRLRVDTLAMHRCGIRELPADLVAGTIEISDSDRFSHCPGRVTVDREFHIYRCSEFASFGDGLRVVLKLRLADLPKLTSLPAGLSVNADAKPIGGLEATDCGIESIPEGVRIGLNVTIRNSPGLKTIPASLAKIPSLHFEGSGITHLPEGLDVVVLDLRGTPIRALPTDTRAEWLVTGQWLAFLPSSYVGERILLQPGCDFQIPEDATVTGNIVPGHGS